MTSILSLDQVLLKTIDEFLTMVEPPLDQNVYRIGMGFIPATYFFLTDVIYFLRMLFFGPSGGGEVVNLNEINKIHV